MEKLTVENDIIQEIEQSATYNDQMIDAITKLKCTADYINNKISEDRASRNIPEDVKSPTIVKKKFDLQIKLPKIELKDYDGSLLKWSTFWEQFKTSINNNEDLSDIQKFTYLKTYLVGEAERAVQGVSFTTENYKKAIEILNTRFGSKQLRISAHMKELRTLKSTKEKSSDHGYFSAHSLQISIGMERRDNRKSYSYNNNGNRM